jgi:glycosyltransferase involved in cell wall biosynthesis
MAAQKNDGERGITMNESATSFAFVKMGGFSGVNERLLEQLRRQIPNLDVDVIDIGDLKPINRWDAARLLYAVAHDYELSSCLKRSRINSRVMRTVYCFRKVREYLLRRLSHKKYVFTFQTQSLFDASIPNTPHFLYTDHTHLANLTYPGERQTPMASAEWVGLERSMYQNARLNFTMSAHVSRSLIEHYGCIPTRIECVYAGANVAPASGDNMGLARFAQKNILFVGIDWERKGGPALVEAFREVRRCHPTATLTIVGCAPNVSVPGCHVVGRVQFAEVAKFYQTASIFCLPTTVEPFGIVFLEAFSHGLPIVATNIGAIPDFVEHGRSGYLVDCNDPAQLANRLNQLLSDPERCAAFGARGQGLVHDRYTWKATAERLAAHINRCIALDARAAQARESQPPTDAGFVDMPIVTDAS